MVGRQYSWLTSQSHSNKLKQLGYGLENIIMAYEHCERYPTNTYPNTHPSLNPTSIAMWNTYISHYIIRSMKMAMGDSLFLRVKPLWVRNSFVGDALVRFKTKVDATPPYARFFPPSLAEFWSFTKITEFPATPVFWELTKTIALQNNTANISKQTIL